MSHHKDCPSTLMVQDNQLLQPIQNTAEQWIKLFCSCMAGRSDLTSKRKTLLEIFVSFPGSYLWFRIAHYLVGMLSPLFSSKKRNFRFSGVLQEAEYCNKEEEYVLTSTPTGWLWHTAYLQYIKKQCLSILPSARVQSNVVHNKILQACLLSFSSSPPPCNPLPILNTLFLSFGNSCNTGTNCYRINSNCLWH